MTIVAGVVILFGLAAIAYALARSHEMQFDRAPDDPVVADRLFVRSIALLGVCSALAVNGFLQLALLAMGALPHTLDIARLWVLAGAAGIVATLAMMGLAGLLLRRSHRTFRTLLEIATIGLVGTCTTAFVELNRYNRAADTSAPVFIDVTASGGGYLGTAPRGRLRVQLHDANRTGWATVVVHVSGPTGQALMRHQRAVVEEHAGAVGVRWIRAVRPVIGSEPSGPRPELFSSIERAVSQGAARDADSSDVADWFALYEQRTKRPVNAEFRDWVNMHPAVLVEQPVEVPGSRTGNGTVFLVRPTGALNVRLDPESIVLQFEDPMCIGRACVKLCGAELCAAPP